MTKIRRGAVHIDRAVTRFGSVLTGALRLPGQRIAGSGVEPRSPGSSPGIEKAPRVDEPPGPGEVTVRLTDYGPKVLQSHEDGDLEALLGTERPGGSVRWINVDGLHPYVISRVRQSHSFHTLAGEDILHVPQRSKVEAYDDHLYVVVHMLMLRDGKLTDEQVSLLLFSDTLVSFQERAGDVWDPVRKRMADEASRLRKGKPAYLLYALLDAIVDQFFPILEHYGDRLEEIEERIVTRPSSGELHDLYGVKRELVMLRRVLWPMRQLMDELHRNEFPEIDKGTRTFLRDVYDHTLQVLDIVETYREMASGLTDLYMSSISNRMNEVMKVLTIMASLFIPVTFVAGVYGMNFEHIPELSWPWAYACFWGVCTSITVGLLIYFKRKGWIGPGS